VLKIDFFVDMAPLPPCLSTGCDSDVCTRFSVNSSCTGSNIVCINGSVARLCVCFVSLFTACLFNTDFQNFSRLSIGWNDSNTNRTSFYAHNIVCAMLFLFCVLLTEPQQRNSVSSSQRHSSQRDSHAYEIGHIVRFDSLLSPRSHSSVPQQSVQQFARGHHPTIGLVDQFTTLV
jgi:hypothetical protein